MKTSCPVCNSSKGEKLVSDILNKLSITFHKEYFVNIDDVNYRFDFFIPEFNIIIEYDGIQHFMPVDYFGGQDNYDKIKINDSIKNKWCEENSVNLIRLPYNVDVEYHLLNSLSSIFTE